MQEGDSVFRYHSSGLDSACLTEDIGSTHHLADEGDPFASTNWQHR